MMPPPPKACPESPELELPKDDVVKDEPEDEPEDELPLEEPESVLPVLLLPLLLLLPPEVSVELPGAPLAPLGLPDASETPGPPAAGLDASGWQPPIVEFEPMPIDELRPFDPKLDDPMPDEPMPDEPKPDDPMLDEPKLDDPMPDEPKLEEPRPDELGPFPPQPVPPMPLNELASGFPKKPKAVGCLFWP
jgi:hypothetical protein